MSITQEPRQGQKQWIRQTRIRAYTIAFLALVVIAATAAGFSLSLSSGGASGALAGGSKIDSENLAAQIENAPSVPVSTFDAVRCTATTLSQDAFTGHQTASTDMLPPVKATTADAQVAEISATWCTNPTAVQAFLDLNAGLPLGNGKTLGDVPWVKMFHQIENNTSQTDADGQPARLNTFVQYKDSKDPSKGIVLTPEYQRYASYARYVLKVFQTIGDINGVQSLSNMEVRDRAEFYGATATTMGTPAIPVANVAAQQESKSAVALGITEKQGGCSYVIGFNLEDQRPETFPTSVCNGTTPSQPSTPSHSTSKTPSCTGSNCGHTTPPTCKENCHTTPPPCKENCHTTPPPCKENCHTTPPPCKENCHTTPPPCTENCHTTPPPCTENCTTTVPKDPSKDPVNQGNAPTGGGKNDQSGPGNDEGSTPTLPTPPATPRQDPPPPPPSSDSGGSTSGGSSTTNDGGNGGNTTTPSQPTQDPQPAPSQEAPVTSDPTPTTTSCAPGIPSC